MIVDRDGKRVFLHPESGEPLETPEDFRKALDWVAEKMQPYYRVRRNIMQEQAERFEAVLPPARSRTQVQERVARCPRCGEKLDGSARDQ